MVGVAAIVAAIALVVSVSLLVTRTDSKNLATPGTAPTRPPPVQDEITHDNAAPPPPPPTTEAPPPPPPPTSEAPPPPPPTRADQRGATAAAAGPRPAPPAAAAPPPAPAAPRPITYSVTGTKAPLDRISITYTDASGMRRLRPNVYIPWSLTVTPISMSEVRLYPGVEPVAAEQVELLDHHQRRYGALVEREQRRADQLLMVDRHTQVWGHAARSRRLPPIAS